MINKIKVMIIICEGKKAKTEENFLNSFYNDIKTFASFNKIKEKRGENITFEFKNIEHKNLKHFLNAQIQFSRVIVYIDHHPEESWKFVNNILIKFNQEIGDKKRKILFSHPSIGSSFEELISFCYSNPKKEYSKKKNINTFKETIKRNYKGDKKTYEKVKRANK